MGDSITDWWRQASLRRCRESAHGRQGGFDQYYGQMKVANFGISGDTTQGVLYRLRDGEGQGFQPKAIMLMIGTNNGGNCSTAGNLRRGRRRRRPRAAPGFPGAKILLLGIFPRANPGDPIRRIVLDVNPIIARLHDGQNVFYLDIGDKFLNAGALTPDIMADRLHPTQKGYGIWAEAVKVPLAELLK